MKKTRVPQLSRADLGDANIEPLICNQCGGAFCDWKARRIVDGKVVAFCAQKPKTRELLKAVGKGMNARD